MARVASSGGVEVALHELGGRGRTLLFAHANGFNGHVFAPLAHHLRHRFRCVAVDLRGHGDARFPADVNVDWPRFADDVLAAVDHLDGTGMLAVGHSLGGAALTMAEQDRPGTFSALYLYEPILPPPGAGFGGTSNPMADAARRRRRAFPSLEEAIANFAAKPPLDALHPDALRAYVEHGFAPTPDGRVELRCPPEVEARIFESYPPAERFERLAEVRCPVTVAGGRTQVPGPAAFAAAVAEQLANGRVERFGDLGHFGPLEDPPAVAAAILRAFGE